MLKNYLKLTIRNIQQQPGYTLLNVLGLTVGITATPFILAYFMRQWLETFDYHTDMNLFLYQLALLLVVLITLLTTGYHALGAVCQNPVEALRYE